MVVSIELTDKIDYTKKPLTIAEQIARLKQRGLIFDDESEATSYLFNISYYRLRAYTLIRSKRTVKIATITLPVKIFTLRTSLPFIASIADCAHSFSMQLKRLKWQYAQRLYKFMPKAQAIAIGTMMKVCIASAMTT